ALGLQLDPGELGQPAQLQLQDVVRLQLGQVEDLHQAGPRCGGVVAAADQLDDLVDVQDRDQQTVDQVQPLLPAPESVCRAAADHVGAEVDIDREQLPQPQRARLPVDQRHVVDAEGLLHRRQLVELGQDRLGVEAVLDLDDEVQALLPVGEVGDVGDALQL